MATPYAALTAHGAAVAVERRDADQFGYRFSHPVAQFPQSAGEGCLGYWADVLDRDERRQGRLRAYPLRQPGVDVSELMLQGSNARSGAPAQLGVGQGLQKRTFLHARAAQMATARGSSANSHCLDASGT